MNPQLAGFEPASSSVAAILRIVGMAGFEFGNAKKHRKDAGVNLPPSVIHTLSHTLLDS